MSFTRKCRIGLFVFTDTLSYFPLYESSSSNTAVSSALPVCVSVCVCVFVCKICTDKSWVCVLSTHSIDAVQYEMYTRHQSDKDILQSAICALMLQYCSSLVIVIKRSSCRYPPPAVKSISAIDWLLITVCKTYLLKLVTFVMIRIHEISYQTRKESFVPLNHVDKPTNTC